MTASPGTRLATWSLVCAAAFVPMYLVTYGIGALLGAALDVAEGQKLTTAGAAGWAVGLVLVLLLPAPQAVGLWLGVRGRRTGGGGRATAGIVANAAIGGFLLASGLVGLLFS